MDRSESSGLRLIAAHLAQVKLDAAENEYVAKVRIRELERALDEASVQLEECFSDLANYKAQIQQLQSENTYKALVAERDKWKKLIDTLRKDKAQLRARVDELEGQLGISADSDEPQHEDNAAASPRLGSPTWSQTIAAGNATLAASLQRQRLDSSQTQVTHGPHYSAAEWIQLQGEVKFLRNEIEHKEVEIIALRNKLDRELELKWERQHQGGVGWQKSLLESFAEVLAPYPSSPPPSPTGSSSGGASHKSTPSASSSPAPDLGGPDRVILSQTF